MRNDLIVLEKVYYLQVCFIVLLLKKLLGRSVASAFHLRSVLNNLSDYFILRHPTINILLLLLLIVVDMMTVVIVVELTTADLRLCFDADCTNRCQFKRFSLRRLFPLQLVLLLVLMLVRECSLLDLLLVFELGRSIYLLI